jgi:hypothetical protein
MPSWWNYIFLLAGPLPIVIALCRIPERLAEDKRKLTTRISNPATLTSPLRVDFLRSSSVPPSSWLVIDRTISPQRFL